MKVRLSIAAAVIAAALGLAVVVSCDEVESYLYSAQKYDPANACVEAYAALEIVKGSDTSATCERTCFSYGGAIYVSNQCPPLPLSAEALEPDSGECLAAVDASVCGEPALEEDAGEEAGEEDAGEDEAGDDAEAPDARLDAPADG
jgi:hypothetical protein